MRAKIFDVNNLLWLALALALAGSLKHLAAIFASVDGNLFMGWLQAVAIDAGLFALAYSIRVRRSDRRSVKPLWFGVGLFTTISIYGNLAYGLMADSGSLPAWIVASRPYVLAASLPILVLFLSELLSDDRQHAVKVAEREARKAAKKASFARVATQNGSDLATINENKLATKEQRMSQLAGILATDPGKTNSELATLLDVSRATIRNYKDELAESGNLNGKGVTA